MNKVSILLIFIAVLLVGCAFPAADTALHVSIDGSDETGDGSLANPWRTIQRCADAAQPGDVCAIHAGTYRETVRPARSGAPGKPIRFAAYQDDVVTISGADVVTGWTPTDQKIYAAPVDWTLGRGKDQVFANGAALVEARHPNSADSEWTYPPLRWGEGQGVRALSPLWLPRMGFASNARHTDDEDRYRFTSERLTQPADFWRGGMYVGWHYWGWSAETGIIESSAPGGFLLDPDSVSKRWFCTYRACYAPWYPDNGRGVIIGTENALDAPGEWWLDTENGLLKLWLPESADPNTQTIEVKRRQLAFDLRERSYIELADLNIFAASLSMAQGAHNLVDDCRFEYVSHFTLIADGREGWVDEKDGGLDASVLPRGLVGIYIGGEENRVQNSVIRYSAGAGLILQGNRHVVYNNLIEQVSYAGTYLSNIFITYDPALDPDPRDRRGGHIISYNTLSQAGRSLIHINGLGTAPERSAATFYEALTITHNHLFDGMLLSNDGGLVYGYGVALGTSETPSQLAYNVIHDSYNPMGGLVFWDNGVWNVHNHHNILWGGEKEYAFNPPGDDRPWKNNHFKQDGTGGIAALTDSDFPGGRFAFGFGAAPQPAPPLPTLTPVPAVPDVFLEAESFSAQSGIQEMGAFVGGCDDGDWLAFDDVYFASGYARLTMRAIIPVSNPNQKVEVRLDNPAGEKIGEFITVAPEQSGEYVHQTIPLQPASGAHTLYIVCRGAGRIGGFDWFRLEGGFGATATPAPKAVNLALKRPVTVSSLDETGSNADWAVDGNPRTRWTSLAFVDPQWIVIDLGERRQVARVILRWEAAYARAYRIQVSDYPDGAWTDIYVETQGDGGVDDLQNLNGAGRYLRVFGEGRGSKWGYSLWEVEVYDPANAALVK